MLRNPAIRRPVALLLVIAGGVLIFLATEAWLGAILVAAGIAIEWIGITLMAK